MRSFPVTGRSSNDPRNDDSAGLHGLPKLFISSIWLPESTVSIVREQVRRQTGQWNLELRVPDDITHVPQVILPMSEDKEPENFFSQMALVICWVCVH